MHNQADMKQTIVCMLHVCAGLLLVGIGGLTSLSQANVYIMWCRVGTLRGPDG